MNKTEFKEILRLHELWLEANPEGKKADLSGADLRWVNLRGADLRGANLKGANLNETNLNGVNLCGADLSGASLYVLCADFVKGIDLSVISTGIKHRIVRHGSTVYIGCHKHSIDYWLENFEKIGKENNYSSEEIQCYRAALVCLSVFAKKKGEQA